MSFFNRKNEKYFVPKDQEPEVIDASDTSEEVAIEEVATPEPTLEEVSVEEVAIPESTPDEVAVEEVAAPETTPDEYAVEEVASPEAEHNESEAPVDEDAVIAAEQEAAEAAEAAAEQAAIAVEAQEIVDEETRFQTELAEHLADLTVVDARVLPELVVPDWRQELEFVKERYEPCDLTDHIVKVSKRRLISRRIDHELAQSRLSSYNRYLERASRRFKEKIDEDATVQTALSDLYQWRSDQAKSVAWRLAERVNDEVLKAKNAELEATTFVVKNTEFNNEKAIETYRNFARRAFLIPVVTLYLISVVALTHSQFEWIMKFLPFFNLGISKTFIMMSGVGASFWLANLWKYAKAVAKTQKNAEAFVKKYEEQHALIKHAVKEHTRLSQQQPLVEPILRVLAKAYRVQLQSDITTKAQVTTEFDSKMLPACVTLARAADDDEIKMARLKRRALTVLMSPGWRTNGLNEIARIHADSRMLDSHSLSLKNLDTDSVVSATNAQKLLLEAFANIEIHERVSRTRLVSAIKDLHKQVLTNYVADDRPRVYSLRDDGFDKISFRTSWLADEDASSDWIEFLNEILDEDTAPFSQFNILDKNSDLNKPERISSVAVVPKYFPENNKGINIRKSVTDEVMPLDIVVRVDVSSWAPPSAFTIFAEAEKNVDLITTKDSTVIGGATSA